MRVLKRKIIWTQEARVSLKSITAYIRKSSPAAADKVKYAIIDLAESTVDFPDKFHLEPYLLNSQRNIRSVSIWSYKVIYEVTIKEIVIVDVFDGRQDPSKIKIE